MSDREALEAALEIFYTHPGEADKWLPEQYVQSYRTIAAAARARLAQLPEKCEHGWSVPHTPKPVRVAGGVSADEWCPGKVYPTETVEKIKAVVRLWGVHDADLATNAVLNALGETP